jgi:hypothetical protein
VGSRADARRARRSSILALDLIAFGLSVVTGLAREFGEFLSDTFLGTHAHTSVGNTPATSF